MGDARQLRAALAAEKLVVSGVVRDAETGLSRVMVGPDEPEFWPSFAASPEYQDGAPDPMDRWSRRVFSVIADEVGGTPHFPFGGPPYDPFFTWAIATGQFWPSPIGFLVHAQAGLFTSFRGALSVSFEVEIPDAANPCPACTAPCKTACPVDAFADGYDVAACKAHLNAPEGVACMQGGCLARRACPVGRGLRLPEQAAFHMRAFR